MWCGRWSATYREPLYIYTKLFIIKRSIVHNNKLYSLSWNDRLDRESQFIIVFKLYYNTYLYYYLLYYNCHPNFDYVCIMIKIQYSYCWCGFYNWRDYQMKRKMIHHLSMVNIINTCCSLISAVCYNNNEFRHFIS